MVKHLNDSVTYAADFSEVRGREHVRRALEFAEAGQHNVLMVGIAGSRQDFAGSLNAVLAENPIRCTNSEQRQLRLAAHVVVRVRIQWVSSSSPELVIARLLPELMHKKRWPDHS